MNGAANAAFNVAGADVSIVIPTVGRASLADLLATLADVPAPVIVVDDRRDLPGPLAADMPDDVTVLRSGGRGPAAARNAGWRAARTTWVAFLDDDVLPHPGWWHLLTEDLHAAQRQGAVGSQGLIEVPQTSGRPPTDDERRTQALADAQWITADMAYRRAALVDCGGFDERFPRAYREDSDLALRITAGGGRIVRGSRRATHPVAASTWLSAVRAQRGNADDALMRRKHGRRWRSMIGEGSGRLPAHSVTVLAALTAVSARGRTANAAGVLWISLVAQFTLRRFRRGPRTAGQLIRLLASSVLIPPAAVWHRVAGQWRYRRARKDPPLAVLFDRDDTLIADGPYLNRPEGVRPLPGVHRALHRLRGSGLLLAVVTNQSGVARGLISAEQLTAVNDRVDELLGPFDNWQVCAHGEDDGCGCRKPRPGMVLAAADALGVHPHRCILIGDTGGDVQAALSARAGAVLVPTARTRPGEISDARECAAVAADLEHATALVLRECR